MALGPVLAWTRTAAVAIPGARPRWPSRRPKSARLCNRLGNPRELSRSSAAGTGLGQAAGLGRGDLRLTAPGGRTDEAVRLLAKARRRIEQALGHEAGQQGVDLVRAKVATCRGWPMRACLRPCGAVFHARFRDKGRLDPALLSTPGAASSGVCADASAGPLGRGVGSDAVSSYYSFS